MSDKQNFVLLLPHGRDGVAPAEARAGLSGTSPGIVTNTDPDTTESRRDARPARSPFHRVRRGVAARWP